jgi:DNA modification methylase
VKRRKPRAAPAPAPAVAPAPRRAKHPRNTLNELDGEHWLYFTRSVLRTSYPREIGHEIRKRHGANKPPRLMQALIEFFTRAEGRVLDPFAGVGGTLLGASLADPPRKAVGIEINPRWAEVYREVADGHPALPPQEMVVGDALALLADRERFADGSFDFVATDPPYNVHLERTMCDGKYDATHANRRTDYDMRSDDPRDLANLGTYERYLEAMGEAFAGMRRVLRPGGYVALIVRNAYQDGEYLFTHADLARRAKSAGLVPKGEIVWYQTGSRLRPYGYPHAYVPNIAHQFVVILQSPRGKK